MSGREADARSLVGSFFAGKYRVLQHLRSGGIADIYLVETLATASALPRKAVHARSVTPFRLASVRPVLSPSESLSQSDAQGRNAFASLPGASPRHVARNVGAAHPSAVPRDDGAHRLALKVLRSEFHDDPAVVRRFERGAASVAHISHPNVAMAGPLSHLPNGVPYCTLELLEGLDLADTLAYAGALSEGRAARIAEGVAAGLVAAHEAGVVHLDVKPENIFLVHLPNGSEHVKLLDFGGFGANSRAEAVCSTPEYMAPEQVRGAEVTPAMDVFALGVVLFEMLFGFPPPRLGAEAPRNERPTSDTYPAGFRSELRLRTSTPTDVRRNSASGVALTSNVRDVSSHVRRLLERALAFDPRDRFVSMAEFHSALTSALEQTPSVRPVMAKRTS